VRSTSSAIRHPAGTVEDHRRRPLIPGSQHVAEGAGAIDPALTGPPPGVVRSRSEQHFGPGYAWVFEQGRAEGE
jgi:hypothetical protein